MNVLQIAQEDLLELLGKSITCAILSKAGPQRSRLLGMISKDEKLRHLDQIAKYSSHNNILNKMNHEQLLTNEELQTLIQSLMPHQKAVSDVNPSTTTHLSTRFNLTIYDDLDHCRWLYNPRESSH